MARVRRRAGIAVLGLGRMGRLHATNLAYGCPTAELACVVDADAEIARREADRLGVRWATSADAALSDDGVDAVVIATPTSTHAEVLASAVAAGKHVLCEKPLSSDRASTIDAIEATRKAGLKLQVGFHRRFDPDWAEATRRIAAGELGEVYLFRTSLRDMVPPPPQFLAGSGGFFVDVTIHDLDTARWMVGEVSEVSATGAALSDPGFAEIGDLDHAVVVLRFESGALGVIDNSRVAGYGYECSTEVVGSAATVRIDHPQQRHVQWLTPGQVAQDVVRDFVARYPLAYADELKAFGRCILDDVPPAVSGLDGLAAFDLAGVAELSMRVGRPIPVGHRSTADGPVYDVPEARE